MADERSVWPESATTQPTGSEGRGVPDRPTPLTPEMVAVLVTRAIHGGEAVTLTAKEAATLTWDWFRLKEQVVAMTEEVRGLTVYVDDLELALRERREKEGR